MIQKLRQESRVVEKRKVETKYGHFLRIAQKFYKAYIQRLSARYDIPGLKRVARNIEAGEMDPKDMISPVPAELGSMVLSSCHSTLICLGDLARYRVQAKHKKSFDMALAFYSIAHDLIPDSGYAFSQMGIVSLEQGSHLDAVYHFYRAWAVKNPHPMARQNVEAKFKDAQKQNAMSRGKGSPPSAYEPLTLWFVRLHALIYKGEPVSAQHNELEREVIHRLSTAAKDANAVPMLLKMALVNMSACWVASTKYNGMHPLLTPVALSDQEAEDKSKKSAHFHQYILHFSTRFLLKLCEVMEIEFNDSLARQQCDPTDQHEPESKPSAVTALLPVLRVYCIWIGACRSEIFTSPNAPIKVVPPLAQSLARVFTFLFTEIYNFQDTPASCPYLLPEDIEARGLLSFSDDQVPGACKSYCTEDGNLKPYRDEITEPLDASREAIARIWDLLRSAYFLVEDPTVPLTCGVVGQRVVFQYQPAGAPGDVQFNTEPSRFPEEAATGYQPEPEKVAQRHQPGPETNNRNGIEPNQSPSFTSGPHRSQEMETGESSQGPTREGPAREVTGNHLHPMSQAEKTVVNMLSPFLEDPIPQSEQGTGSPDESSYGMHSTTANELARELLKTYQPEKDEPAPYYESLSPGQFGSSTWNYFLGPTPSLAQVPESASQGAFYPSHGASNRSSRGSASLRGSPGASPAEGQRNQMRQASQLSQSFAAPNGPQKSPASNWPTNRNVSQPSNPWAQQAPAGAPGSSAASAFSHPSSLYQSTPYNATIYGQPAQGNAGQPAQGNAGQPGQGNVWNIHTQNGATQEGVWSTSRPFRMDDTASSYDAAILQGAWQGAK